METLRAHESRPLLLVDDDELELSLLADRLSAAGYRVATAQNGAEAKRMLEHQSFPVIVTDYQMPEMDGLQLADTIRSHTETGSYVIVWSIRSTDEDRERSFAHGVDDHISKLSTDAELFARIETGFQTMHLRESLQRSRRVRAVKTVVDSTGDVDVWNAAAGRLHGEITRAERMRRPLTVLMLHVEHALSHESIEISGGAFAPRQLACLAAAVGSVIRHSVDWVAALDASAGLARLLVVLPETGVCTIASVRQRIHDAIANLSVTDEFAALMPECAVGVAGIEAWTADVAPNAALLVAMAECQVERLTPRGN